MKTFKILTSYPCLVKSKDQTFELDENSSLVTEEKQVLAIYPIGKSEKFAFNVSLFNLCDSQFYCTVKEEDKTIIYLVDGLLSENKEVVSFGGNLSASIEVGQESITFCSKAYKKVVQTGKWENFDCMKKFDIQIAHLFDENKHLLIAFNEKTGKAKQFKAQEVEIKNDKITLTQKLDDMAGHNLVTTFKIDNEGLKKTDCQISYIYDSPRLSRNDKTIPYAFLEAAKADNFSLASKYLSQDMHIDEENLKSFIGKLDFFFPLSDKKFFVQTEGERKTLTFEIESNKIVDIID